MGKNILGVNEEALMPHVGSRFAVRNKGANAAADGKTAILLNFWKPVVERI
jgi:hypothetical protein